MTDTERENLIELLTYVFPEYYGRAVNLDSDTRHLRTEVLHDIRFINKTSGWSLNDLQFAKLVMKPLNGEYRIRVVKRLAEINRELLNPWSIKNYFGDMHEHEPLVAEDVTDEHLAMVAVMMVVGGGNYAMFYDEDLGFLREPVDEAQHFLKLNWSQKETIREIIMTRRVYKPEDIKELMTGGAPLHNGAL